MEEALVHAEYLKSYVDNTEEDEAEPQPPLLISSSVTFPSKRAISHPGMRNLGGGCNAFAPIRLGSAEKGNNPQFRARAPVARGVIIEGWGERARGDRDEKRSLIRRPSPKLHVPAISLCLSRRRRS